MPSRRHLLSMLGAGGAALSGCSGIVRPDGGSDRQVAGDWRPGPGEWSGWGYDLGNTAYNPHANPPDTEPTVDWAVECDRPDETVVADGTVVCRDRGSIVARNAADGHRLWDVTVALHGALTYVDGRIYDVASGRLTAVSLDGDTRWEDEAEGRVVAERDGYVYVGNPSGGLQWHDVDTGERAGSLETAFRSFAAADGMLFAAGYDGVAAYAVDDDDLSEEWFRDDVLQDEWHVDDADDGGEGRVQSPHVAVADGTVCVLERSPDPGTDASRVRLLDAADGSVVATRTFDRAVVGGPVLGPRSYVGLAQAVEPSEDEGLPVKYADGELLAFDGDDRVWRTESVAPALHVGTGSTLLGTRIEEGRGVVAAGVEDGRDRWTVDGRALEGGADESPPILAPVAVVDETVYARADGPGGRQVLALRA